MPSFLEPLLNAIIPKIIPAIGKPNPNITLVKKRIEEGKYKSRGMVRMQRIITRGGITAQTILRMPNNLPFSINLI